MYEIHFLLSPPSNLFSDTHGSYQPVLRVKKSVERVKRSVGSHLTLELQQLHISISVRKHTYLLSPPLTFSRTRGVVAIATTESADFCTLRLAQASPPVSYSLFTPSIAERCVGVLLYHHRLKVNILFLTHDTTFVDIAWV